MGDLKFKLPLDAEKEGEDKGKVVTTSPYGMRTNPKKKLHSGLDLRARSPKVVMSSERGLVIRASEHPVFGETIVIDHTPLASEKKRHIFSLYAHLSRMDVERGDFVSKDHPIAFSGNSGPPDTPYHLHFGIYESKDPEKALEWKAEGDSTGVDPSNTNNPADYLFRTLSVEGTIADADDLQDQVRDRIQEVMELVPTVKPENRFWRMDIMVYGKYVGYLDTRNQEITLEYTILEAIELLHKPITKRKTEYVVNR